MDVTHIANPRRKKGEGLPTQGRRPTRPGAAAPEQQGPALQQERLPQLEACTPRLEKACVQRRPSTAKMIPFKRLKKQKCEKFTVTYRYNYLRVDSQEAAIRPLRVTQYHRHFKAAQPVRRWVGRPVSSGLLSHSWSPYSTGHTCIQKENLR